MARIRFHQYAWGLLAYNLCVVLGGAYVRASFSGDGCGDHWPDCNGHFIPHDGPLKQFIEVSHRYSTGLLGVLILGLIVWAFLAHPRGHSVRKGATFALLLTVAEALIGAWLVRFHLVAHDESIYRAIAMPIHLVTTFLLLMSLTLTAWWASGGRAPRFRGQGAVGWAIGLALVAVLTLGISGAITALGDMLFPAPTLLEGIRQDFLPSRHFLLGLRIYHPLIAMTVGLYLTLVMGLAMRLRPSADVERFARLVVFMFLAQMGAGLLNFGLQAPIWMQLVHLLLADLLWISLVLLAVAALAEGVPVKGAETGVGSSGAAKRGLVGAGAHSPAAAQTARRSATWRDYVALTKPRVISLLLFTTVTAMFIAAGGRRGPAPSLLLCLAVGIGFYMAAGAANAFNMLLERDLDLRMGRTGKRPTVTQAIPVRSALLFAVALMVGSFLLLWGAANLLSAMLAMAGLAFYVVIYTLLLKRRTWANIVIGGAAGAFPPLVGWAAVTGDLSPLAWLLFGIIFLWTPVHFWALALLIKEDYARAGVPMLPVVRGERATVAQIAFYAVLTVGISVAPMLLQGRNGHSAVGWIYLGTAVLLNVVLLAQSLQLYRQPDRPRARSLFHYSMIYLALLFLAMAVDRAHWI